MVGYINGYTNIMKRIILAIFCLSILLIGMGGQPAYAAGRLTKMVVGCRNFLVTGNTFVITPTSQFSVLVTDSAGQTVYTRIGNMPVGRYGGFSGLFSH